jgi:hypothetical protein
MMAKEDVLIGVAVGVAIAAITPLAVLFAVGAGRRPLVHALARGGQVLSDKARETFAELQEITEDLVAEMRASNAVTTAATDATAAASSVPPSAPAPAAQNGGAGA